MSEDEAIEEVIEAAHLVSCGTVIADRDRLLVSRKAMQRLWDALDVLAKVKP